MLGDKAGTLTLKETSKPIASGRYGLPAMETHNVGSGKLVGHDVMGRAHLQQRCAQTVRG